jgi:hypothetical protein
MAFFNLCVRALCAAGCVSFLAACSDDENGGSGPSGDDSDEAVIAYVKERLAPAQAAFDHPSGVVSATSMPNVITSLREANDARSYGAGGAPAPTAPAGSTKTAAIEIDLGVGIRADDPYASCRTVSNRLISVDMGCMTKGKVRGTSTIRGAQSSEGSYIVMRLIDICRDGTDGPLCMNGESLMFLSKDNKKMDWDQDVTITTPKLTHHAKATTRADLNPPVTMRTVGWDGDASFVIEKGGAYGDSGEITLSGSNGKHTCKFSTRGQHGSCTIDGKPAFSW